jgi:heptosyltransferase-2
MKFSNKKKYNSILIVRLSSMGDILLTTSLVRQLENRFPDASIDFAAGSQFSEIYKHNPRIRGLFEYDKALPAKDSAAQFSLFMKSMGMQKYDLAVDLQNNIRSYLLLRGRFREVVRFNKRRLHKLSLVYLKRPLDKRDIKIPELYLETVAAQGVVDDGKGLEFWLPEESGLDFYPPERKKLLNAPIKRIAFAPGAHHFTKRWPAERFAGLADALASEYSSEILLLGGTADTQICCEISALSSAEIIDKSGSTSIAETARLLDTIDLLITNDTGVMHIAAARRVPVVAVFGSTVTSFGFAPYRTKSIIVEKELPCRPCTHIGRAHCPKGHFECMRNIRIEDITSAVHKLIVK